MSFQNEDTLRLQYPPSPADFSCSPLTASSSQTLPSYNSPSSSSHSEDLPDASVAEPAPILTPTLLVSPPPYYTFPEPDQSMTSDTNARQSRAIIAHPYARLAAKKDGGKRRKIWNHALEKSLFTPHELSTMGAPHRRTIYMSSLEAHIDRLHAQLLSIGLYPIPFEKLEPFRGLNSKTAKSMIAGLQHDDSFTKLKLLELQRSNTSLRQTLARPAGTHIGEVRRHSVDSSVPQGGHHALPTD